jgi:hypothetical protein
MNSFLSVLKDQRKEFLSTLFSLEEEAERSLLFDVSRCQDSFRFRVQSRSLKVASFLIDEDGEWKKQELDILLQHLEKKGHIIYPQGSNDGVYLEHLLFCLRRFKKETGLRNEIKKFQRPLCHRWAESLVRSTIGLPEESPLTDAHIRRAVLSACLSLLRQNVGSCFATAPAILIQSEQMENLLSDLYELLTTGKLKRIFGGMEFSVPLSPNMGHGDLRKNIHILNKTGILWFSPGLMAAFEAAHIVLPDWPMQKKASVIEEKMAPVSETNPALTIEEGVRLVLLGHYGVTETDIKNFQRYEVGLAKRSRQASFIMYENVSTKIREKCLQFLQAEKAAFSAFKAQADHLLLKAWEFTLASFAEVKMEFSRWNMYSSLGLHPDESGGIGEVIARFLDGKIQSSNQKLEEYQKDYELAFDQLRATEALLKRASSETEARRLQAEFQSRLYHMNACLELRDSFYKKASRYTTLLSFLLKQFDARFPEYFQEIYDAEMQDVKVDQYEDSPAGFRLVYKHGRADASLWTMVYSAEQYLEVLIDFFNAIESQIVAECDWDEADDDIKDILSAIILHIRSEEFLTSAFQRMAKAHHTSLKQDPLKVIEKIEKKPWAYTSGGSMNALLKSYYRKEGDLTEEARWVENETDLFVFLLDTMKALPYFTAQTYLKNKNKAMLMHSTSHAFLLQPGYDRFKEAWEENRFSYTWVRDRYILPVKDFFDRLLLKENEQEFLAQIFLKRFFPSVEHQIRNAFLIDGNATIQEFRNALARAVHQVVGMVLSEDGSIEDVIDSFLIESLPLYPVEEWRHYARILLQPKVDATFVSFLDSFQDPSCPFFTLKGLKETAKACFLLFQKKILLEFDLHRFIATRASDLALAPPSPILFADSNWSHYYFAFIVNPGTGNLELWRMNQTAEEGVRMRTWAHWLNGSSRETWGVFTNPSQYNILTESRLKNNLKKL